jgi:hypothetical protein
MLADQVRAPTKLNSPRKLRADDPAGSLTPLCDIVLIKNDHHSFVSILERPPRCQCRFADAKFSDASVDLPQTTE